MNQPDWREFEKLVARIESGLAGEDVIVKSPDRILDKNTNQHREVDASMRFYAGSAPILVTIECRRRGDKEDVTWIEQLESKKRNIGAHATIAVSSIGFTEPAVKAAKIANIELRILHDITEEEINRWTEEIQLEGEVVAYEFVSLQCRLNCSDPAIEIDPSLASDLGNDGYSAPIAFVWGSNEPLTWNALGSRILDEGQFPKAPGIEPFGVARFSAKEYFVPTNEGDVEVLSLEWRIRIVDVVKPEIVSSVKRYGNINKTVAEIGEYFIEIDKKKYQIKVIKLK